MRLRLDKQRKVILYQPRDPDANALVALPESGPGYQLLQFSVADDATFGEGALSGDYIAFNAELLVPIEVIHDDAWASPTDWPPFGSYDDFKMQPGFVTRRTLTTPITIPGTGTAGSPRGTLLVTSTSSQTFWRYSAFSPDLRISSTGAVAMGTYLVSDKDHDLINTGLGAVGRLALPNPFPATYLYQLNAPTGLRRPTVLTFTAGTVRPAFGQAGGGVEAVLALPAPAGTVTVPVVPSTLPDL